jgi:dTDP-4-amino-4,6-dideoxygalactose transaminase
LHDSGVETAIHYPVPVHLQKAYAHLGYKLGDLPVTEALCEQCLSLPLYPELSRDRMFTVASMLRELEIRN